MKVRRGFVANSSSSSFVVAIPEDLRIFAADELHNYLYGPQVKDIVLGRGARSHRVSSKEAVEAITHQLIGQEANSDDTLALWGFLLGDGPETDLDDRLRSGELTYAQAKPLYRRHRLAVIEYAESRLPEIEGKVLYRVDFHDYGGDNLELVMRHSPDNFGAARRWEHSVG
jgi:hypothetical protein